MILANEKLKYFLDAPVLRRAGPEEVGRGGGRGERAKLNLQEIARHTSFLRDLAINSKAIIAPTLSAFSKVALQGIFSIT